MFSEEVFKTNRRWIFSGAVRLDNQKQEVRCLRRGRVNEECHNNNKNANRFLPRKERLDALLDKECEVMMRVNTQESTKVGLVGVQVLKR